MKGIIQAFLGATTLNLRKDGKP